MQDFSTSSKGATSLLDRLDSLKQIGPDTWRARCPAHEGRSLSLSVKYTGDTLLIKCFAGCSAQEVVEAAGLKLSDLFDKTTPYSPAVARKYQINTSAKDILEAIVVPVRAVMMAVQIQQTRKLSSWEFESFIHATETINKALDTAVNQGVVNVR